MTLSINNDRVAEGHVSGLLPAQPKENFCIGFDDGQPVGNYDGENRFSGKIEILEVRTVLGP
jgi:hypothetical protein